MNIKEKYFTFYEKYPKLNFIDKPSHLTCGVCNEIFKYPHQTLCGCKFCFHCLLKIIENGESHCPGQTEDCVDITVNDLSFDAAANKDVMKYRVHCPHESCKIIKTLKEIIDHVDECEYRMVKCSMCNGDYQFKNIKKHEDKECPNRQFQCKYCFQTMTYQYYTSEHLNPDSDDLCENYSIMECPNKCNTKGFIDNFREHLKICSKAKQKCPLSTSGCSNCKFNDEELKVHFDENLFQHNQYLFKRIDDKNIEYDIIIEQEREESNKKYKDLERSNEYLIEKVTDFEKILKAYQENEALNKDKIEKLEYKNKILKVKIEEVETSSKEQFNKEEIEKLESRNKTLEVKIEEVETSLKEQFNKEEIENENYKNKMVWLEQKLNETNNNNMRDEISRLSQKVDHLEGELNSKIEELESYRCVNENTSTKTGRGHYFNNSDVMNSFNYK